MACDDFEISMGWKVPSDGLPRHILVVPGMRLEVGATAGGNVRFRRNGIPEPDYGFVAEAWTADAIERLKAELGPKEGE